MTRFVAVAAAVAASRSPPGVRPAWCDLAACHGRPV